MTERILTLMKHLGIPPSRFADEIGVQRSAMSHLVSGRNNPSLEFITRVLKRYPQVSADWLLSGSGPMIRTASPEGPDQVVPEPARETEPELFEENPEPVGGEPVVPDEIPGTKEKQAEKIYIVFNDRTFRELNPEQD